MFVNLLVLYQQKRKFDRHDQITIFTKNHEFKVQDNKKKDMDLCVAQCFCFLKKERFLDFFFPVAPFGENFEAEQQENVPSKNQDTLVEYGHIEQDGIKTRGIFVKKMLFRQENKSVDTQLS
jgi:hypothetical protein